MPLKKLTGEKEKREEDQIEESNNTHISQYCSVHELVFTYSELYETVSRTSTCSLLVFKEEKKKNECRKCVDIVKE